MKKTNSYQKFIPALFASAFVMPSFADEVIDPSDLTKVYTQAAVFVTSDADLRVSSMFTGAWTDSISFAGFVEGNIGNADKGDGDQLGIDYLGGRAQYFQVHQLDNRLMPSAGFSTDLIHMKHAGLDDTTLLSVGAIGLIHPSYTPGFMAFPNIAYTVGNVFGESADGFMLNLFATVPMGDSGAFLQVWPEYFSVSGDEVEMESKSINMMFNAPLKSNRTQWLMTKLEYNQTDIVMPRGVSVEGNPELKAEIGMKWFF